MTARLRIVVRPTSHAARAVVGRGFSLVAAAVASVLVVAAQLEPTATLKVIPDDGMYVSGAVTLRASVDPIGTKIEQIAFYADGQLVCTVTARPYECQWDAGPGVTEHAIRVVATLAGGVRIAKNVRTKDPGFAETVDVDVVQVTATVVDDEGGFVRGLTRQDFRIYEDDVPQRVTHFASENIPLELVTAVDVSGSMAEAMPLVKDAVRQFFLALRPEDQVTLLAFNDTIFTLARRSTDPQARVKAVDRLSPWGGTSFYDVTITALNMLGRQAGRRALVVFSDGEDQTSQATLEMVQDRLAASDATVYAIGQGRGVSERGLKEILSRMTRLSGGRAFFTDNAERLSRAFTDIVEELSNQYLLTYPPTTTARDDKWRSIRVELVNRPGMKVRARQGYQVKRQR